MFSPRQKSSFPNDMAHLFSAVDLIKKMMTVDSKKRPTLADVLNHPWFKVSQTIEPFYRIYELGIGLRLALPSTHCEGFYNR